MSGRADEQKCGRCGADERGTCGLCYECYSAAYVAPIESQDDQVRGETARFVREKLNPIIGACLLHGEGRMQFGMGEASAIPFLVKQTDALVAVIADLVSGMRDLKASRNFPGENPKPDYDAGIEDCVSELLRELGAEPSDRLREERTPSTHDEERAFTSIATRIAELVDASECAAADCIEEIAELLIEQFAYSPIRVSTVCPCAPPEFGCSCMCHVVRSSTPSPALPSVRHVCGLQGFQRGIDGLDDICQACEESRNR